MRSNRPMPGNPWPHDMVIRVEDDPHALVDLLFVRAAWGLTPLGDDLPPALEAPASVGDPPRLTGLDEDTRAAWTSEWPDVWRGALAHAGTERDHTVFDRLSAMPPGSPEREALLDALFGPNAQDAFGEAAFPDELRAWTSTWSDAVVARMHTRRSLDEEPERVSLSALIPAWEAGLTTVVVVPVVGEYTRRVGPNALVVAAATRDAPARYARALASFC